MNSVNIYSLEQIVLNSNGNSADLYVGSLASLAFDLDVLAIDAGATLNLYVDRKGDDGNYYPIYSSASITTTGLTSESIGGGMHDAESLGNLCRVRWTITATKTATVSLSLVGNG